MLLKGRVVVVTGAAKRIGRAIALRLAREGARVAIHYNGSEAEARATAAECDAIGSGQAKTPAPHGNAAGQAETPAPHGNAAGQAETPAPHGNSAIFQGNLESVADIEALFTNVEKHFGRIDALVNNAGRFTTIDPLKVTEADWDFIHSVNLKAAFFCAQQAAKRMIAGDGGRIVILSSLGGLRPWSKNAHYCASKAGVIMLTKALAKSFAPKVTVNSVAPGAIVFGEPNELEARLIAKTPACRAGTAEDIADAVLFFLTTTSFITGQVIAVDGGLSQK